VEIVVLASAVLALGILEHQTLPRVWNASQAKVLFLGTSHTYEAIDPAAFDRPIGRLTFPGVDLELSATALLGHIDRWPQLEMVVIEVDDFSLLTDRMAYSYSDLQQIVGELHLWSTSLPNRAPIGERWLWKINNLFDGKGTPGLYWRRRPTLDRILNPEESDAPFVRPKPEDRAAPILTEKKGATKVKFVHARITGPAEPNLTALEKLVSHLTRRNIGVVLISYPLHEVYEHARPEIWEEVLEEALLRASLAAGQEVLWLDHRFSHGMGDDAFMDVDHLNETGAAQFSARLAVELARASEAPIPAPPNGN
jgi:hypothetical protein